MTRDGPEPLKERWGLRCLYVSCGWGVEGESMAWYVLSYILYTLVLVSSEIKVINKQGMMNSALRNAARGLFFH